MKTNVFISYNSKDFEISRTNAPLIPRELKEAITRKIGLEVFYDRDSIHHGDMWLQQIRSALKECRVLILLAGPRFFDSAEMNELAKDDSVIRNELLTARQSPTSKIIPVFFNSTPPHKSGQSWPDGLDWLNSTQWTELDLKQHRASIDSLVDAVARELALDQAKRLGKNPSLFDCLQQLSDSSPELHRALVHTLRADNNLASKVDFLRLLLMGDTAAIRKLASSAPGLLKNADPRWILLSELCSLEPGRGIETTILLESFADRLEKYCVSQGTLLRNRSLKSSATLNGDQLLSQFLYLALQRTRERIQGLNLKTTVLIEGLRSNVDRTSDSRKAHVRKVFKALIDQGICVESDKVAFRKLQGLAPVPIVKVRTRRIGQTYPRTPRKRTNHHGPTSRTKHRRPKRK